MHSQCSANPTNPWIRGLGGRECYTAPEDVYTAARARGMDFVTITDHNTLDGSFAIAHLPGTFLSTEFDAWFPENGCRVHVVALGIDEATFAAALQTRSSIYDLVACLREAGVVHYLAHPLFDMTGKLTEDVVEKLLLLFNVLEGRNGARVVRCNGLLRDIAGSLTPERIADMAERQGIEPYGETPWRKALTGGSDDHSGLFVAGVHTVAACDGTVEGFLDAVGAGAGELCRRGRRRAHPRQQHLRGRVLALPRDAAARRRASRAGAPSSSCAKASARSAATCPSSTRPSAACAASCPACTWTATGAAPRGRSCSTARSARSSTTRTASTPSARGSSTGGCSRSRSAWRTTSSACICRRSSTPPRASGFKRRLQKHYAVAMVHFLQLPHFISWSIQSRDRASQERLRRYFLGGEPPPPKVAVFTDTWDEADHVSLSVRLLAETAVARGVDLEVITSTPEPTGPLNDAVNFQALATRPLSIDPDHPLTTPPIVDILDYLEENDFTAIHASTAGGMGLVAMLAAKLLHLPIAATFHADLPRQAERLRSGALLPAPVVALRAVVLRHHGRGVRAVPRHRPRARRTRARPAARERASAPGGRRALRTPTA